jgi:hypothetical protein
MGALPQALEVIFEVQRTKNFVVSEHFEHFYNNTYFLEATKLLG